MFKNFFKKKYKSRNLLSPEEITILEEEQEQLLKEVEVREKQIDKFKSLILQDPDNLTRYVKRMKIHSEQKRNVKKVLVTV
jgi:hypothetical protein